MFNDFDAHIDDFSFRATRILVALDVTDVDSLVNIFRENLIKVRGCGKKTITEIEALQESFRASNSTSQISNVRFEYDDVPREFFEALLGILSYRSRNILAALGINNLKAFMLIKSDQLIKCRHCGPKTVAEVLTIQSQIKNFIRGRINKHGFFKPEDLIKVPCLSAVQLFKTIPTSRTSISKTTICLFEKGFCRHHTGFVGL
jgi:DNA repair protein RadC